MAAGAAGRGRGRGRGRRRGVSPGRRCGRGGCCAGPRRDGGWAAGGLRGRRQRAYGTHGQRDRLHHCDMPLCSLVQDRQTGFYYIHGGTWTPTIDSRHPVHGPLHPSCHPRPHVPPTSHDALLLPVTCVIVPVSVPGMCPGQRCKEGLVVDGGVAALELKGHLLALGGLRGDHHTPAPGRGGERMGEGEWRGEGWVAWGGVFGMLA